MENIHVLNRVLMKLFKSSNIDIINVCSRGVARGGPGGLGPLE